MKTKSHQGQFIAGHIPRPLYCRVIKHIHAHDLKWKAVLREALTLYMQEKGS